MFARAAEPEIVLIGGQVLGCAARQPAVSDHGRTRGADESWTGFTRQECPMHLEFQSARSGEPSGMVSSRRRGWIPTAATPVAAASVSLTGAEADRAECQHRRALMLVDPLDQPLLVVMLDSLSFNERHVGAQDAAARQGAAG